MPALLIVAILSAALAACENSLESQPQPRIAQGSGEWRPTWAAAEAALLRPGVFTAGAVGCTVGFLYVDPVTDTYYASLAAHCVDSADGTTNDSTGQRIAIETGNLLNAAPLEIGSVVYDSDGPTPSSLLGDDASPAVDFILIRLDPGINLIANPQVLELQGPTGFIDADCAGARQGDTIAFYGQGQPFQISGQLHRREGPLLSCSDTTHSSAVPVYWGDSGSPVLHTVTGKALGFLTSSLMPAVMFGTTLPYVFSELAKSGFGSVALATVDGGYAGPPGP